MSYIEREAAYPLAKKVCDAIDCNEFQRFNFGMLILDWIDDIPAADVRPVVRGKWRPHKTKTGKNWWKCSACDYVSEHKAHHNYCPNCGADMREES